MKEVLENSNGFALPGWEPERLAKVQELFAKYKDVDENTLRQNLVYFLERVIPVCEEVGIKMAIHPDDPPYSIFGLPRIVKNRDDLDWICNAVNSEANGITLCTGSIAEDPDNNVYEILAEFTRRRRIHFAHVRNIKLIQDKDFYESAHLSRYGSLDMYEVMKALHDNGFNGYIRPDHGRFIWGETGVRAMASTTARSASPICTAYGKRWKNATNPDQRHRCLPVLFLIAAHLKALFIGRRHKVAGNQSNCASVAAKSCSPAALRWRRRALQASSLITR